MSFFWQISRISSATFILVIIWRKRLFGELHSHGESYYFIQEGVYSDKEILDNNLNKIGQKIIDYKNDKFYVYVGITKDKDVANKLQKIYEKKGFHTIQKEKYLENEEFSNNVTQFDLLINATDITDEILTIEEVVLANYDELIKNSSKN